jgi:hypothetical protein
MKSLFVFIWFIAIAGHGAVNIIADSVERRSDLHGSFIVPKDNPDMMEAFYRGDFISDEKMTVCIRDAIAINDDTINRQLITYIYWKVLPYFDNRTHDRPERKTILPLESIETLKPFLIERLHDSKPHHRLYEILLVLYKNDKNIIDILISIAKQNDQILGSVINACLSAGIYNNDADDLVVLAIASEFASVSSVAAYYLQRRPVRAALPHLVSQLCRLDSEVDYSLAQVMSEYFYVEPEIILLMEAAFADDKIQYHIDDWRVKIIEAIMKYDPIEISQYASSIMSVRSIVDMGPASSRSYERLISLIE